MILGTDEVCEVFWTQNSESEDLEQIESPYSNQKNVFIGFEDQNDDDQLETPNLQSRSKNEPINQEQSLIDSFRINPVSTKKTDYLEKNDSFNIK